MEFKVSLIASAIRQPLFNAFFKSLETSSIPIEVVFAGTLPNIHNLKINNHLMFKYIHTGNIKPAQCYEIARRNATGELVCWVADDCEFANDVIGKAYNFWKERNNEKLILSIQTKESGYNLPNGALFDMRIHRFFGGANSTPLMAPLGMISRAFLNHLGGIDRRYISGQYENDIVMRAYQEGGTVKIFGDATCFIDIDHLGKSFITGESKTENDFLKRPFAEGYPNDRKVLESSWSDSLLHMKKERADKFEPFEDKDILIKSQSNNISRWV